jgi:hypothetical protein
MKHKTTIGELLGIDQAFKMLVGKTITGLEAYKMNKLIQRIKPDIKAFEETKNALIKANIKEGETNIPSGTPEFKAFTDAIDPVLTQKVDFEFEQFPITLLDRITLKEGEGGLLGVIDFLFKEK